MATIPEIISKWTDNNGVALPFARLYSYAAGSTVPKGLYSDYACTIPLSNPLVADGSGKFREFFLASGRYRFVLCDQTDALIDTRDDVDASGASGGNPGTVTSVQLVLGPSLDVSAQVTSLPVTNAGNIDLEWRNQPARKALMSLTSGTGKPSFRSIEWADIVGTAPWAGLYLPLAGGTMDANAVVNFGAVGGTVDARIKVFGKDAYGAEAYTYMYPAGMATATATDIVQVNPDTIFVNKIGTNQPTTTIKSNQIDITDGTDYSQFTRFWGVFRNSDSTIRSQLDKYRLIFSVNGSTAAFEPSQFNLTNSQSVILGSAGASAGIDISVSAGVGDASCVTRRVGFATTQNATTMFSTTSGSVTAADFNLSSQTTCFVGQDLDIRNGKSLLLAGTTRISSGGAGTFTGLTSTGGAAITGVTNLNGATRPAWIASMNATQIGNTVAIVNYTANGADEPGIMRNIYTDGSFAQRYVVTATATWYATLLSFNRNGSLLYQTSVTNPVAGNAITDMTTKFSVSKDGNGVFTGSLSLLGASMPSWGGSYAGHAIGGLAGLAVLSYSARQTFPIITQNCYNDGTNWRSLATGSSDSYPTYLALSDNGIAMASSSTVPASGGVISDLINKFTVSRQGGVGFFGTAAPTTRPTINAACTDLATSVALLNQIRANLIACGMMQ